MDLPKTVVIVLFLVELIDSVDSDLFSTWISSSFLYLPRQNPEPGDSEGKP